MTTAEAKHALRQPSHVPNTNPVWLPIPCLLEPFTIYDIEHSLKPTDVTNHFSGYPITKLGAELWTCYGNGGQKEVVALAGEDTEEEKKKNDQRWSNSSSRSSATVFRFSPSRRAGRCCVEEGQIPTLFFWKL